MEDASLTHQRPSQLRKSPRHVAAYTSGHMSTLVIERHERASLRSRAVAAGVRGVLRPRMTKAAGVPFGPAELRRAAAIDKFAGRFRPPRGIHSEPVRLDGFGAEWVHGPGVSLKRDGNVILYFHG